MQPTDPEYKLLHDKACLYFMTFYQELFAICCKATKADEAKAEELMSDVVLARLPRIIELWDETKPLTQYVNSSIRWYVLKELVKERQLKQRYVNELQEGSYVEQALQQQENVEHLLKDLNELERNFVLLYVLGGYTYKEIGELSGFTRIRVSIIVNEALDKLYNKLA